MEIVLPFPEAPTIVVVGGGFAAIDFVKTCKKLRVNIVVIDRHNYHTFQPLLYQVATGGLEAGSISYPLRKLFTHQNNVIFRMAEAAGVDVEKQELNTSLGPIHYDYLVLATGTETSFFGNEQIKKFSFPLKTVPNALDLRASILINLEKAVSAINDKEKQRLTNIVIAGGGPTGVELAGALAELRRIVIPADYPELDSHSIRIFLVDGGDRVLGVMSKGSSARALMDLNRLGVEVIMGTRVLRYDGVNVALSDGTTILTDCLIWAAGVQGTPLFGLPTNIIDARSKRVKVDEFNRIIETPNIFVIGDLAMVQNEKHPHGHPMVAPAAKQHGKHLGKNFARILKGEPLRPFKYMDKGSLATIGRNKAVADFGFIHFSGFFAWFLWMGVHLIFLAGFRNRMITAIDWIWNYFTYDRFVRAILRKVERPMIEVNPVNPGIVVNEPGIVLNE